MLCHLPIVVPIFPIMNNVLHGRKTEIVRDKRYFTVHKCSIFDRINNVGIKDEIGRKKMGRKILAKGNKVDVYLDNHFLISWAYVSCQSTTWSKEIVMLKKQS